MNEFLVSDESLNGCECVVLTSGIRLERFLKNPIMLFMHNRSLGVAGRWENLRIDGGRMYAMPVFDDVHEPGKSTKEKVESGFLKGASIGIEQCVIEKRNGIDTVVSCSLLEISICDIPSNQNALQLYYNEKPVDLPTFLKLSLNDNKSMNEQEFKSLLQALGLPEEATVQEALNAIAALKRTSPAESSVKENLSLAYKDGIVSNAERSDLEGLFSGNPLQLNKYLETRRLEKTKEAEMKFEQFVQSNRNKFKTYSHDFIYGQMKQLALKDFGAFSKMIEHAPELILPTDFINKGQRRNQSLKLKSEWSLEDYRKNAPQELQRNPELYQELLEKENNKNNQ